jgi:hypothetical protein
MNERLTAILSAKRRYSSYFHFANDPAGTEVGVISDWVTARLGANQTYYVRSEHRKNPFDPPDVVLTDKDGGRHGFEVTELVDSETVRGFQRKELCRLRNYEPQEFYDIIESRVREKSSRPFKGLECNRKYLVIYSAEPVLGSKQWDSHLRTIPRVPTCLFDELWFMIPPAVFTGPKENPCPNCRIYDIPKQG